MLALVRLGPNAYGVTIQEDIESRTERSVNIGAVYATLDRLEKKGLVSWRRGASPAQRGGRPRRYFKIEAPGAASLERTLQMLDCMRSGLVIDGVLAGA